MELTQEEIKARLDYNPKTGVLTWKNGRNKGKQAGHINQQGYRKIRLKKTDRSASRLIWILMTGEDISGKTIDHKDRNRDNNRWNNLRIATREEQNFNKISKGYRKAGNKYAASIRVKGKDIYLGIYKTKEEAHAVYLAKCRELRGEFSP